VDYVALSKNVGFLRNYGVDLRRHHLVPDQRSQAYSLLKRISRGVDLADEFPGRAAGLNILIFCVIPVIA